MAVETKVHSSAPKHANRPHYEVMIPNEVHQFIHYMGISTSTYSQELMTVTSRYKVGRPMRTKQVKDVADMISDIYKVGPLNYPKVFQCDNGSEFKAEVTKMLEKCGVTIRCITTKYKHMHMAFIEALNKLLAENLFKVQDAQELNNPKKVSSTWVKHLYGLID